MIFKTESQLFDYIRANQKVDKWVVDARKYHKKLLALIDGEGFNELLINEVEHIEGTQKAIARKKYARSIKDFYARLLRLTDNIYSSTGGIKRYENLSDSQTKELESHLHKIKGGKTLESWLESVWLTVYHQDPNGIIFLEYDAEKDIKPQPSYKSINAIRNYVSNGQTLEVLLFEPLDLDDGVKQWHVVDDEKFYVVNQSNESFYIVEDETFAHEFGIVPAVVNSDIEHIGYHKRLSPVDKVVELSEEYARDLSVKTIYKFQQGFPKHWRYASPCMDCHGTGKDGNGNTCGSCGGTGELFRGDVTHEDRLTIPEDGESVIAPGSGFVTPDLAFLADARVELKELQDTASFTHWGAVVNTEQVATATEIVINTQPVTMRLNKYADTAEYVETLLTEMIANNMFLDKAKDEKVSSIAYGRNYIIESLNAVLERYENAKEKGDSSTILDRLYQEYLLNKYKSDNVGLQIAIVKSKVEPYIHYTVEQVNENFGSKEAQRKVLFDEWWKTQKDFNKTVEVMTKDYDKWLTDIDEDNAAAASGGGNVQVQSLNGAQVTSMVTITSAVTIGDMPKESAIEILIVSYGMTRDVAKSIIDPIVVKVPQPINPVTE